MSKFPPSRSQVPVDERSVLATVPGLPWWGAVLTLLAFTGVGALAADSFAGKNAGMLAMCAGAIVAVLAVRNRALFTAMVQPPLVIATAIPIYRWFSLPSPRSTSQILTDVLFPFIAVFPWMFWITAIVIVIGSARLVLYRRLTATARSAQKTAAKSGAAKGPAAKGSAAKTPKKPTESAGLPIGERLRAAFARMRPTPVAAGGAAAGAAAAGGAAALVDPGSGAERHQSSRRKSSRTSSRSSRSRDEAKRVRNDAKSAGTRDEAARAKAAEGRPHGVRSSASRRSDPARDADSAPATAQNRVVRPDSAPFRRPQPGRRPVADGAQDAPRGARPRPADRPRPVQRDPRPRDLPRDPREMPRDPARDPREPRRDPERAARRRPVDPDPRDAARRAPRSRGPREAEADPPSGPRRAIPRPDGRDFRREARDLDGPPAAAPRPRAERDRPRIPRDDFASLPRISGGRVAQPDLPSLGKDSERPRRSGDAPAAPGRYEHYRAPRYRPQRDEQPPEANFRDDFTDSGDAGSDPRPIRRHRYKD